MKYLFSIEYFGMNNDSWFKKFAKFSMKFIIEKD